MNDFNFFLPISKVEKADDGSRIVSGYASTPTKDLDGEVVSIDAIKAALPDYMVWRNIRSMHKPDPIGKAQEASVDATGLYVKSKIVAEDAIKLIDAGVLQAYSIGGRKLAKSGDTITELELIEISLVDRPANPDCRVSINKAAKDAVMGQSGEEPAPALDAQATANWLEKAVGAFFGKKKPATEETPNQLKSDDDEENELKLMAKKADGDLKTQLEALLAKRSSLRSSMTKANTHVGKAASFCKSGMGQLAKAMDMCTKAAGDPGMKECLSKAAAAFGNASDQHELAMVALTIPTAPVATQVDDQGHDEDADAEPISDPHAQTKVAKSLGGQPNPAEAEIDMTEDEVKALIDKGVKTAVESAVAPLATSIGSTVEAAIAKALGIEPKKAAAESAAPKTYSEAEVDLIKRKAELDAREAALAKLPAQPKAVVFSPLDKSVGTSTDADLKGGEAKLEAITKFVPKMTLAKMQNGQEVDRDELEKANRIMFGNLIGNPELFAKSINDPNFRGAAGKPPQM